MAIVYLGNKPICPVMEVEKPFQISLSELSFEIYKNEYYSKNDGTVTSYNNWDRTSLIDVSDVDFVALPYATWQSYSVYQGSAPLKQSIFLLTIDGIGFYVYDISTSDTIGFSATASSIASLKLYKCNNLTFITPRVTIDNNVENDPQPAMMSLASLKKVAANQDVVTYPKPAEIE